MSPQLKGLFGKVDENFKLLEKKIRVADTLEEEEEEEEEIDCDKAAEAP